MSVITEEELADYSFCKTDAIFVYDKAHVHYLLNNTNSSLASSVILALTADAHGAAVETDTPNVVMPYDHADYKKALGENYADAVRWASNWLGELDLCIYIDGIELSQFDAVNQLLFFQMAAYIADVTESMLASEQGIETFYVLIGHPMFPSEYYLDSDAAANIVKYICEKRGKNVTTILMRRRLLRFSAWGGMRPFMKETAEAMVFNATGEGSPSPSTCDVGFVPACIGNLGPFFNAFDALGRKVTVFSSVWSEASVGRPADPSVVDPAWADNVAEKLSEYWAAFIKRRDRSTLPDYIVNNPYVLYQIEYIIRSRWLSCAKYIYSAGNYAKSHPLDLFVFCDHFVTEGAVLAHFYRRNGARIVVVTHSLFPVGWPFVPWDKSDTAIVMSKTAADIVRTRSGITDVFVVGTPKYGADHEAAILTRQKMNIPGAGRKIILLVTNCLEVQVPLVNIQEQFAVISLLAQPPAHLKDKVFVVARTKVGVFAEECLLYRNICRLSPESLSAADGLSFSDCVDVADCVLGMNPPTSGYTEVMQKGVPIIHVDTAEGSKDSGVQYPREILNVVTDNSKLWSIIESTLFDETYRKNLIDSQRRFAETDGASEFGAADNPLKEVFRRILDK